MIRRRPFLDIALCVVTIQLCAYEPGSGSKSDNEQTSAPAQLMQDDVRTLLMKAVQPDYEAEHRSLPDASKLLDSLAREFERSPSLFTMLDYGLVLEAHRPRRPRRYGEPPAIWTDPIFSAMQRRLERYTVNDPLDRPASVREWWLPVNAAEPVIYGNSKRKEAFLSPAEPSLFKSDVDVFAFSGVPHMERQRQRLGGSGFQYQSPFEPLVQFQTIAQLLGNLAPLVEMFKVEGAGTVEIAFGKPQEVQGPLNEWSAVVDTGSGTLVGAGGRWPVYAVAHSGVIKGTLTRIVSNGSVCGGGEYNAVFTFDRPLPKSTYAILRTTVPLDPAKARITTVRELTWFVRPSYESGFWYADLDGDRRHDLAVTIGSTRLRSDDYFTSSIYANVGGRWKLLMRPEITSCT